MLDPLAAALPLLDPVAPAFVAVLAALFKILLSLFVAALNLVFRELYSDFKTLASVPVAVAAMLLRLCRAEAAMLLALLTSDVGFEFAREEASARTEEPSVATSMELEPISMADVKALRAATRRIWGRIFDDV